MKVIKNIESTSIGKTKGKNDDGIYIGKNYALVTDGVSSKSGVVVDGKKVRIADLIIDAVKKIDNENAPMYAKALNADEFIKLVNMYIKKYCDKNKISLEANKMEATAGIYSKELNQVWLIGDCRVVYDGIAVDNDLEADNLYTRIRLEVLKSLFKEGYTKEDIFKEDLSAIIISNPKKCSEYIKDKVEVLRIRNYIDYQMYKALIDTGFTDEEIITDNLLDKFYKPQILQDYAKNNPNAKKYGYSVFNGINTPVENCKIIDLPENVKSIRLSSDGFPLDILKDSRDIPDAIRKNRKLSEIDPISIREYVGIHNSIRQNEKYLANDDSSAIEIKIVDVKEEEKSRD